MNLIPQPAKVKMFPIISSFSLLVNLVGCSPSDSGNETADSGQTSSEESASQSEEIGSNPLAAPVEYLGAAAKAKTSSQNKIALASIQQAIQMYQIENGSFPPSLEELVKAGQIRSLPALPQGAQYQYDPRAGTVSIVSGR